MMTFGRRGSILGTLSLLTNRIAMNGCAASPTIEGAPARAARRLRVLCLHGYHGNTEALRAQIAALAEGLDDVAELVFMNAPSIADGDYGWWHAVSDPREPPRDDPGVTGERRRYSGWERARDAVVARFAKDGPFDGVLGFSQGAAMAGLLVGLRAPDGKPTRERPLAFDFAIVVSGFPSRDPDHEVLYARRESFALPSLHLVGRADRIVPPSLSRDLASRFASPTIVEHGGGHVIAGDLVTRERVAAFLRARLLAKNAPVARSGVMKDVNAK